MREQREVIYAQRQEVIMEENDLSDVLMGMVKRTIGRVVDSHTIRKRRMEFRWDCRFCSLNTCP